MPNFGLTAFLRLHYWVQYLDIYSVHFAVSPDPGGGVRAEI
jgi:hypothetical protein